MAAYASREALVAYVEGNDAVDLPGEPEAVERLLEQGQRDVDRALGPYPESLPGALKIDPDGLSDAQAAALSRATCAACEFRLMLDAALQVGDEDYLPATVTVLRRAQTVSPKMLEELSGSGLRRWSGCAAPTPIADELVWR